MHKKLLALVAIIGVVALAAMWAAPRSSEATSWNPFFGPSDFYRLNPSTPGANGDTHAQFNVFANSANFSPLFGRAITFGDPAVTTASAADIPRTGAYMGQLSSTATLGLANEGCNQQIAVTFNFVDANVVVQALPMTPDVTLTAAINNSQTSFTYTSTGDPIGPSDDNPSRMRNEIEIDSEQMLIETINEGTNTYSNVTRGWNGTTPAAHNAGAQVRKLNVLFPAGPDSNLLSNLAEDTGDFDNNGTAEFPQFTNNQVSDGADGIVSFIRDSLDPDNNPQNGGAVEAHARYYGVAVVANALIVTLQFVILEPGELTAFPNLDWAATSFGYSSTTFLQDPLAPPSNSAISDFCNFSSNTHLFGVPHDNACTGTGAAPGACTETFLTFTVRKAVDNGCAPQVPLVPRTFPNECGLSAAQQNAGECDDMGGGQFECICPTTTCPRSTNPATAQRIRYYQYSVSQRDYDNDGHENALDVCANVPNADWDPRAFNIQSGSDNDGDGLPNDCDPSPGSGNNDQDGDGWQNRIDTCPVAANSGPNNSGGTDPNTFHFDQDVPAGTDVPDGGPNNDNIAPACDIAGNSCSGCPTLTPTGANGHYHAAYASVTICIGTANDECNATAGLPGGASDSDGDGVVNAHDTCLNFSNPPQPFPAGPGHATMTQNEGAGSTVINVGAGETDGFSQGSPVVISDPLETLRYVTAVDSIGNTITISPGLTQAHQIGDPIAQVMFAQSVRDLNNNGTVGVTDDLVQVAGAAFTTGGNPALPAGYQARFDVNNSSSIGVTDDLAAFAGSAFLTCGPT